MMINYFVTDDDGRILKTGTCQKHLLKENSIGREAYIGEIGHPDYWYAPEGKPTPRPKFNINVVQKGLDSPFRIDNIPKGTLVEYPNGSILVDDGYIEWDSLVEGVYEFKLTNFPYQEEVVYAYIGNV